MTLRVARHRGQGDLLIPDETAGVLQGVGVCDAGQKDLGPMVVQHRRRSGPVTRPHLGQILPYRHQLDAVRRAGRGETVQLGQWRNMGRLVEHHEEWRV
jgi:hypothetical protein